LGGVSKECFTQVDKATAPHVRGRLTVAAARATSLKADARPVAASVDAHNPPLAAGVLLLQPDKAENVRRCRWRTAPFLHGLISRQSEPLLGAARLIGT